MDVDVRPNTPFKAIVASENDFRGGWFGSGASAYTVNTFINNSTQKLRAACYSPQGDVYALTGENNRVWLFRDSDNMNIG